MLEFATSMSDMNNEPIQAALDIHQNTREDSGELDSHRMRRHGSISVLLNGVHHYPRLSGVLLAARSRMLCDQLIERDSEDSRRVIHVENVPKRWFDCILLFVHMNADIELRSLEESLQLLHWADHFRIDSLISFCEHVISRRFLCDESVCQIWNWCDQGHSTENLAERCREYLEQNFESCARRIEFLNLRYNLLKSLLGPGRIRAQSNAILECIHRWVEANNSHSLLIQLLPPCTLFNIYHRNRLFNSGNEGYVGY
jgi:hypothetical protein